MEWVAYVEVLGLYAAAHRAVAGEVPGGGAGGPVTGALPDPAAAQAGAGTPAPAGAPLVVLRAGQAWDGCPLAWAGGLKAGMARRQVLRALPQALLAEYGSVDYMGVARAFWDTCARWSPRVEIPDLHQAFLTLAQPGQDPPERELAALVQAVAAALGPVVLRAGLAENKLLARAAALAQPLGAAPAVVRAGQGAAFLARQPVAALWPARPEVCRRLAQLGIRRVGEVAQVPEADLVCHFGADGRLLARWARGEDPSRVRADWPSQAVTWRMAFPAGATPAALAAAVARGAAALAGDLAGRGQVCQAVSLTLTLAGAPDVHRQRLLPRRQQGVAALDQALQALLREALQQAAGAAGAAGGILPVTALALAASGLAPVAWRQLDLWGQDAWREAERRQRLDRALAALRARFPARAAQVGLPQPEVTWREAMYRYYDPFRRPRAG